MLVEEIMSQIPNSADGSFLSLFNNKNGSSCPFTKKQTKDEIMTMFLAGHETTANALAFTIYLLTQHPEQEARLRTELKTVLADQAPSFEQLDQLTFTRKVIQESLRLYPPAWGTSRHALQEDNIDGYTIPKKKIVNVLPFVMHRSPRFWTAPKQFNPDRFDQEHDKYVYFPFGGGPRKCIGEHFAMMEMTLVLAMLYQRFSFSHDRDRPIELSAKITLRSKTGVWVFVERCLEE